MHWILIGEESIFWLRLIFGSKEKGSLMSNRVVFKYNIQCSWNIISLSSSSEKTFGYWWVL